MQLLHNENMFAAPEAILQQNKTEGVQIYGLKLQTLPVNSSK